MEALDHGWVMGGHIRLEEELARLICDRFASIDLVRFTNSGTEANLYAISAARAISGKNKVVVFEGAYHGGVFTFGNKRSLLTAPFDFVKAPYNDVDGTRAAARRPSRPDRDRRHRTDAGFGRLHTRRSGLPRDAARMDPHARCDADLRRGDDLALGAGRAAGGPRRDARHDDPGQVRGRRPQLRRVRRQRRGDAALRPAAAGRAVPRRHVQQQRLHHGRRRRRLARRVHGRGRAGAERARRGVAQSPGRGGAGGAVPDAVHRNGLDDERAHVPGHRAQHPRPASAARRRSPTCSTSRRWSRACGLPGAG